MTRIRIVTVLAAIGLGASTLVAAPGDAPPDCVVDSPGTAVAMSRPGAGEPPLDDVNWFARPVPNPAGDWIVAVASHNLNYLYNLTTGARVRIPDTSDAVATPDGRYLTVPSHYTSTRTVNFYDAATLLERLAARQDAADVAPVFAHQHPDVHDVYYQSVGVLSHAADGGRETTVYRMMFSGSTEPAPPGFRIVDYTFTRANGGLTVTPTTPMRLCPQITRDLATPFISKDGRYVVAHDDSSAGRPASLKIFEILATDPAAQTSTCAPRVDSSALPPARPTSASTAASWCSTSASTTTSRRSSTAASRRRPSPTSWSWTSPARPAAPSPAWPGCRASRPRRRRARATISRRSSPMARCSS